LIADANGKAATIEFLNGKMVVHQNNDLPFPVLTNDRYDQSVKKKNAGETEGSNSLERFDIACNLVTQFRNASNNTTSPVDYSFDILAEVAQGSFTKWRIVYDITNKAILFKTYGHSDIKTVSFTDVNLDCAVPPKSFDMNQDVKGNIKSHLVNFSQEINKKSIETAFKESAERIKVSETTKQKLLNYAKQVTCKFK
jgi:choloylglycine hydrolase